MIILFLSSRYMRKLITESSRTIVVCTHKDGKKSETLLRNISFITASHAMMPI